MEEARRKSQLTRYIVIIGFILFFVEIAWLLFHPDLQTVLLAAITLGFTVIGVVLVEAHYSRIIEIKALSARVSELERMFRDLQGQEDVK